MKTVTLTATAVVPEYFIKPLALHKGWMPEEDETEEEQYESAKAFVSEEIKSIIEDYPFELQKELRTQSITSQIKDLEVQLLQEESKTRTSIGSKVNVTIEES